MSGQFWLDWSALAVSLFNALLTLWMGLTVLLNAERRHWGTVLAAAGLLVGSAFFLAHSIILSQGAAGLVGGFAFWWYAGWLPVIAAPFSWYLLMLWYSGFWTQPPSPLRRRQQPWLWLCLAFTALLLALVLLFHPSAMLTEATYLETGRPPGTGSLPVIAAAYPLYILLCVSLALDALLRPGPSSRVLGELARRRARPWLVAASAVLLLVSAAVGAVFAWLARAYDPSLRLAEWIHSISTLLSILDLILTAVLMAAILLLGQAVVSYEIFTGKSLPRRGFFRQWQGLLLLSALLSALAAWFVFASAASLAPLLAMLLVVTAAYAVSSWRSYAERQESLRQMQPFADSQRLFESILNPGDRGQAELDFSAPFKALARDTLNARQAALLPLGTLAALEVLPLYEPAGSVVPAELVSDLSANFSSHEAAGLPLDPEHSGGWIWVSPLRSERGLVGLLLLGEKQDGGIYTQEEIEIARAGGERLADLLASAEMARRLVMLQRQRMVASGILDRSARRVLHDEVLPRLHTALIRLGSLPGAEAPAAQQSLAELGDIHRQISGLLRDLPRPAAPELQRLGLIEALKRTVADEFSGSFDRVTWEVDPEIGLRLLELPELALDVLYYAAREGIRNAARHARGAGQPGVLQLVVRARWQGGLQIQVEDNGVGIPAGAAPAPDGGEGLALHSTLMAVINGSLSVESEAGRFTRLTLFLPEQALSLWQQPDPALEAETHP